jgi:hypothetical protein
MKRALLLSLVLAGCKACGRDGHIAEMTKHQGEVTRDTAATQRQWQPANDGEKLAMGDAIRTGPNAGATMRLSGGGAIALSSDTTLRFVAKAPGAKASGVAVEAGEALVEADNGAVAIETTIGVAHIEAGGKLRVSAADGGAARVEVTVGAARIDTESGGVDLAPGKPMEIAVGGAILERADASVPDASRVAEPPAADAGDGVELAIHGAGVVVYAKSEPKKPKSLAEGSNKAVAGDTLEVPNGASIDLRRGRAASHLGPGRYVVGEGEPLVRANSGHVELQATTTDVVIEVPGGAIVAKASPDGKSRVEADIKSTETRVAVKQGQGEVRGKGGAESLRAGEGATIHARGAVASSRGPERADFVVHAGDSFLVRDPRPPTAIAFEFAGMCAGPAVVTRGDGVSSRGDRQAVLSLPAGHHDYTIHCIGPDGVEEKTAASGSVMVVADAARAEPPRLPPSTVVDMDGRRYTVLYQNLLPSVVARWPDAPAAGGYVLHVDKEKTKGPAAKQSLRSGAIGEGTHSIWFETEDGAKKSAETTLVIKFDNAAPTASLREPVDGSFHPGDSVKVAGNVVEGWTVTLYGNPVALDEQKRFSTTATVPAGENALVLRINNPKRGTVYYVRHAGGTQ